MHTSLELREVFHLEFLRWLGKKKKIGTYALKGGSNLRFFFNSIRYSEDMDLDIKGVEVSTLRETVMKILESSSFQDGLKAFGIDQIIPPNITKAKQTETTQRFKVHLITSSGEDLFTKIEFSRRGLKGNIVVEGASNSVLRAYKLSPLLVSHYDILSAVAQKIGAIATRSVTQARDIFDLYILSSQYNPTEIKECGLRQEKLKTAHENVFEIGFEKFRDTVIAYLPSEDQQIYDSPALWDEIQLKVANFINELKG